MCEREREHVNLTNKVLVFSFLEMGCFHLCVRESNVYQLTHFTEVPYHQRYGPRSNPMQIIPPLAYGTWLASCACYTSSLDFDIDDWTRSNHQQSITPQS